MLEEFSPLAVTVLHALYDTETNHLLLCLLTSIEIITHRQFYDSADKDYIDMTGNNTVVGSLQLSVFIARYGYCWRVVRDTQHLRHQCCSRGHTLRSYCPPMVNVENMSRPLTRRTCGRVVSARPRSRWLCSCGQWTPTQLSSKVEEFFPNHFVVVAKCRRDTPNFVDQTELRASSPSYADIVRGVKASPTSHTPRETEPASAATNIAVVCYNLQPATSATTEECDNDAESECAPVLDSDSDFILLSVL